MIMKCKGERYSLELPEPSLFENAMTVPDLTLATSSAAVCAGNCFSTLCAFYTYDGIYMNFVISYKLENSLFN